VSEEQAKKMLKSLEIIEACLVCLVSTVFSAAVTAVFFW